MHNAIAFLEARRASLIPQLLHLDPEVAVIDKMLLMIKDYAARIRSLDSKDSILSLLKEWDSLAYEMQSRYMIRVLDLAGTYPGKYDLNEFSVLNELLKNYDVTEQGLASVITELSHQENFLKKRREAKAEELLWQRRSLP